MGGKRVKRIHNEEGVLVAKECSKCHEIKFVSEFSKDRSKADGLRSKCKQCEKELCKQWRKDNPESDKKRSKRWHENNPEYIKEYMKQQYKNNKEYYKERSKRWRENNPEYGKQYYRNNKERRKEYHKQWYKNNKEHKKEYDKQRYNNKIQEAIQKLIKKLEENQYPTDEIPFGIIYRLEQPAVNRNYVGKTETCSFDIRYKGDFFKNKVNELSEDNVKRKILEDDIEKYGIDSFVIYEIIDVAYSEQELDEKEAYWIDCYKAYDEGYNSNRGNIFKWDKER